LRFRPRSSWARQISLAPELRIRLTTKPGASPQMIGCFLIVWAKLTIVATVSSDVSSPRTTSISGMTDAG
jgi:hypothetical protein